MNEGIFYGAILYAMSFTFYVKRQRVLDTPTAKALSAAIGRAEVAGRALGEPPSASPVSETPSAYWEVRLYHRYKQGNRRRERCIATKNSVGGHFWVEDASGRVPVLIEGAEWWLEKRKWRARKGDAISEPARAWVTALGVDWSKHDLRLEEECVAEGGPVYVLGTLSAAPDVLDASARRRPGVRAFFTQLLTNPLQSGPLGDSLSTTVERLRAGTLQGQARLQALGELPPWLRAAERVVLWRGVRRDPFVISNSGERRLARRLGWWGIATTAAGSALMLAGLSDLLK
ncbi:MAG TPA: hypothetical protein VM528_06220 [Burkholderiaceae bacterium]|nr:hypothetical protein [Burkholderiaceae bacterium]